jgi:integrase
MPMPHAGNRKFPPIASSYRLLTTKYWTDLNCAASLGRIAGRLNMEVRETLSVSEIAALFGLPESAVRDRLGGRESSRFLDTRKTGNESCISLRCFADRIPRDEKTLLTVQKRRSVSRADGFIAGRRMRLSLGTRQQDAAHRLTNRIERALVEGPDSSLWPDLQKTLPELTFALLAGLIKYKPPVEQTQPTWADLLAMFETEMRQRIALGKLATSTAERYRQTAREFGTFVGEKSVTNLSDITRSLVESFKVWRSARIKAKKHSRGATSISLDAAILHRIFAVAVECEWIARNPVRMEGRPGDLPDRGAQPFTAEQQALLQQSAEQGLLTFLLLRWTGLRGSDAVTLKWQEIHFDRREIERITQKRRKPVIVPIDTELLFALETEHTLQDPKPTDVVLLNPSTGQFMIRPRLYYRVQAVGTRAGLADVHPHRFRDTFAVDMLARGASPYDVAKLLGDEIATIEKHYAPFVRELRERVRRLMENGEGIAKFSGTNTGKSTCGTGEAHCRRQAEGSRQSVYELGPHSSLASAGGGSL